ncbi:NADH dehydrogenase subunit 6 (mitochondrion) [Dendronephthya gigantea]|uniref:NADH-ubiquinone oxidoreductase chain 6 n=4 Tax=Dendronephthya TaxID=51109 RepID=G8DLT3_DENML|nr:NADH dehydrogenase subunit 6 [Dendronephthya gigantea]YP_007516941.1 NADH dehydrogenase subunit 6 [Dendronephthya mollis]YP_008999658.1 NADH dehydrogenase subunit 6 [Dendronephthya castanea]ACZ34399.1 NADH dehydrogenase subunit 6 [Dendronephthya suensoni]ACI95028.1 NADH dehydrogenase subunit 6 [Dendronephthya gigantea]ACZ34385.1 NADH dehydrogenase subunit 6 [Dendronephthya castanea]ADY15419.1 NADH dehydrogenase subunit 6 [Dendronephthya mollis]
MNSLFIIISLGIVVASFMVISTPNPVYSVFWLVIAFVNAAVMFISLELDYIGLIFIIVYVGAIAILFLFVIMLIQQPNKVYSQDHSHFLPVGLSVIFLFSSLLTNSPKYISNPVIGSKTNIGAIGSHLYTTYYELVLIASLVLLVAMIGAILLAKQPNSPFLYNFYGESLRSRQDLFLQISREHL